MTCRAKVTVFAGTRPEAIKLAPLLLAARDHPSLALELVFSGQQPALFSDTLAAFGIDASQVPRVADHPLARTPDRLKFVARAWLTQSRPDLVLVQGDTNTALAAAQAAQSVGVPVGHVEAGLRTGRVDRPYPEEPNRRAIAQIAELHFAPSLRARDNLLAEAVAGEIFVTGNPGIDALCLFLDRPVPPTCHDIVLTCHRRENFGSVAAGIAGAVRRLATRGYRILLPLHSNPAVANPLRAALENVDGVRLSSPLPYPAMIDTLRSVSLVISDSGGLQEECAALGTPLLLLRDETERPEVVKSGNCHVIGCDPSRLVDAAIAVMTDHELRKAMSTASFPYGRGQASSLILDAIVSWFATQSATIPSHGSTLALTR